MNAFHWMESRKVNSLEIWLTLWTVKLYVLKLRKLSYKVSESGKVNECLEWCYWTAGAVECLPASSSQLMAPLKKQKFGHGVPFTIAYLGFLGCEHFENAFINNILLFELWILDLQSHEFMNKILCLRTVSRMKIVQLWISHSLLSVIRISLHYTSYEYFIIKNDILIITLKTFSSVFNLRCCFLVFGVIFRYVVIEKMPFHFQQILKYIFI